MEISDIKIKGSWRDVADSARTTINMKPGKGEPSVSWKRRMLLAEHSPLRRIFINAKWSNLPYWVSVHLVRHKIGIEHWVGTQRTDRTGEDRNNKSQNAPVEHEILATYQAIIAISRKRLCSAASKETRDAWNVLLKEIEKIDPELYSVCVPDCVYRGWCMEYKSCGFHRTENFETALSNYREGINELADE